MEIELYFSKLPHQFHLINNDSINAGVNKFVDEIEADMLCMIRRKRNFLAELFHTSITRKEAFHSHVPLLILQDDD